MKIESLNKEVLYATTLRYLGCASSASPEAEVRQLMDEAFAELEDLYSFKYIYAEVDDIANLLQHPAYSQYLSGATGCLLCASTLGVQVDRRIKRLEVNNMSYSVVFDAAASAYLECCADAYEASLPFPNRGFRFCPGYGGTDLADNRIIAQQLHAERIGITFLDSGLMVPMKSMVGIVRLGGQGRKSCAGCVASVGCTFRQSGTTCWSEE